MINILNIFLTQHFQGNKNDVVVKIFPFQLKGIRFDHFEKNKLCGWNGWKKKTLGNFFKLNALGEKKMVALTMSPEEKGTMSQG